MANEYQKLSSDYQRTGKEAMGSMLRSAGDYRKSLQEISFEWAEFSKRSVTQAIQAQAELTKKAFAAYMSELTKLSMLGLYGPLTQDASSEGAGAAKTRDGSGSSRTRKAAPTRNQSNNKQTSRSGRAGQRTAAQRASTPRKTGPAKTRKAKRGGASKRAQSARS